MSEIGRDAIERGGPVVCEICGRENAATSVYCENCGSPLNVPE